MSAAPTCSSRASRLRISGGIPSSISRRTAGLDASAPDLLLQRLQQVLGSVVVDLQVGIARHAEDVALQDAHAREEAAQVGGDDVLERDEDPGSGDTNRPSSGGILTRAKWIRCVSGSSTRMARLSDRFEM